ncbi:MAG TPA: hypothetical protein VJ453_10780, partial [Terriglobales bacterium]|nr:hypothetical protein [Terriglobales bacterium]
CEERFEGGVAYPQLVSLQQVANQLCTLSQTYIVESAGKIGLYPDRARASSFTLTSDHITAASFIPSKTQLRGAQNRFIATFRDLNPQKNADIDTSANTGLSRTGGVLTVKVPAGQVHGFLVNDNVDIVNPDTASFAGTIKVTTVISSTQFSGAQAGANATSGGGYVGTTESRFAQRTKIVDHEQHQLAVGQRGLNLTPVHRRTPVSMDLGNNTMERVERILNFVKARNLGADVAPYSAPFTAEVQASMYSVDGGGNALIAQLPGDIITIDKSVSEEYQGDYEITPRIRYNRAGSSSSVGDSAGQSAQADTIDLTLKQYLPGAFSDVADLAQYLVASSGQNGNLYRFAPSQYIPSAVPGAATLTDIPKGIDGDQSTFAEFKITSAGGGSAPELSAWYATFPAIKGKWKSLTLYVKSSVPTNTSVNGGSTVRLDYYKIFTGSSAVGTSGGTIFTTGAGATRAITTDSVVLPLDVNLGQVAVFIDVLSFLEAAGVILTMRIYDVWIDAVV